MVDEHTPQVSGAPEAARHDHLLWFLLAALVAATVLLSTVLIVRAGGSDNTLAAVAMDAPPRTEATTTTTTPAGPPVTVEPAPDPTPIPADAGDGAYYATRAVDQKMQGCGYLTADTHVIASQANGQWIVETTVTHEGYADTVSFEVAVHTLELTALDQLGAELLECM